MKNFLFEVLVTLDLKIKLLIIPLKGQFVTCCGKFNSINLLFIVVVEKLIRFLLESVINIFFLNSPFFKIITI